MTTGADVASDGAKQSQDLLGVLGRFDAPEHPFSSAGRPVGVLGAVIEPLVRPVLCFW